MTIENALRDDNLPDVVMNYSVLVDKHHTHVGLTLFSDGTWDEHVRRIHEKAAARLNLLRMLKYNLHKKSILRFYISYIRTTGQGGSRISEERVQMFKRGFVCLFFTQNHLKFPMKMK